MKRLVIILSLFTLIATSHAQAETRAPSKWSAAASAVLLTASALIAPLSLLIGYNLRDKPAQLRALAATTAIPHRKERRLKLANQLGQVRNGAIATGLVTSVAVPVFGRSMVKKVRRIRNARRR